MLPPVLEVYVVWHPADAGGPIVAQQLVDHFHGTAFTGLIGGAVEVFIRSVGWRGPADAPRPVPVESAPPPNGVEQARFTVVVPLMGTEMAAAVEQGQDGWRTYLEGISNAQAASPDRIAVFPYLMDPGAADQTRLGVTFGPYQRIAASPPDESGETAASLRCRDLTQGITQFLSGAPGARLTVFISHTKRGKLGDEEDTSVLIDLVRSIVANTRLADFFDANDLQPGSDWDAELRQRASTSALLAIRTDLYPSREWCQREVALAKTHGMPVITMDALDRLEERGSFLMDHVARVPVRIEDGGWSKKAVYQALNLLVNECLKRALWRHQQELAGNDPGLNVQWWSPHAPEPLTLAEWLESAISQGARPPPGSQIRILHPDPPLGPEERRVLDQILGLGSEGSVLDIMTPRQLAARGG